MGEFVSVTMGRGRYHTVMRLAFHKIHSGCCVENALKCVVDRHAETI